MQTQFLSFQLLFFILLKFPKFCSNGSHPVLGRKIDKVGDAMVDSGETRPLLESKINAFEKVKAKSNEREDQRDSL